MNVVIVLGIFGEVLGELPITLFTTDTGMCRCTMGMCRCTTVSDSLGVGGVAELCPYVLRVVDGTCQPYLV